MTPTPPAVRNNEQKRMLRAGYLHRIATTVALDKFADALIAAGQARKAKDTEQREIELADQRLRMAFGQLVETDLVEGE